MIKSNAFIYLFLSDLLLHCNKMLSTSNQRVYILQKKKNSTLGASATNQIILNSKRVKQIILFIEAFFFLRERSVSHTPCALGLIEYELI